MNKSTENKATIIVTVAMAILLTIVLVYTVYTIHNTGHIQTIGVETYSNPEATDSIDFIEWGDLMAGGSRSVTLYAKNIESTSFFMTFNTTNWKPAVAEQYLTLSWDYDNSTIQPNEILMFSFTLTVDENIQAVNNFSFDINIKATKITGGE